MHVGFFDCESAALSKFAVISPEAAVAYLETRRGWKLTKDIADLFKFFRRIL